MPVTAASLGPCPCGGDARWYRAELVTATSAGRAISNLTADDLNENLCDGCFLLLVPEGSRDGWTRAEPTARERGIDQTSRHDPFDVCDIVPPGGE